MIKKTILMLIAARILMYSAEKKESTEKKKMTITIIGALPFVWNNATKLAICNDSYW
jgi:uncharacterized membrane protein